VQQAGPPALVMAVCTFAGKYVFDLRVEYDLWDLPVLDRGSIVVPGRVGELERHPSAASLRAVDPNLAEAFSAIVGVKALEC
jgi:hypothetical protein